MSDKRPTLEDLDEQDKKRREKSLEETRQAVERVLDNEAGIKRLLAIGDEEWAAAVEADREMEGSDAS